MYLGMSAVIGAYHARNQGKKAIENKLARIERGIPAWGSLSFGRTFDPSKPAGQQWGIDEAKLDLVRDVSKRLLAGESLERLAREYGMEPSYLSRTLRLKCGDRITVKFDVPDLKVKREITVTIPRLLDDATIEAVRQKLEANRTYAHKPPRSVHDYLLKGRVFCAGCGSCLTGQPKARKNGSVFLYYRHHRKTERTKKCPYDPRPNVPAKALESAVLSDLFELFGNPAAIERAVKAAIPDCDKLLKRKGRLETELKRLEKEKSRVIGLFRKDLITEEYVEKELREANSREATLRAELDELNATLADVPDAETVRLHVYRCPAEGGVDVQDAAEWVARMRNPDTAEGSSGLIDLQDAEGHSYAGGNCVANWLIINEPDRGQDRHDLISCAFSTPLPGGKPSGVYVTPAGGDYRGRKQFAYRLRGRLLGGVAQRLRS
jgi:hypothetical protein